MKKILYIFLALITLASCTDFLGTKSKYGKDCIVLNIFNSPMTKAVDPNGEVYERTLKRLDCFFYVKGQTDKPCVYYQKVDIDEIGSAEIPLYVDELIINTIFPDNNSTCDVFVIANLPDGTYTANGEGTDVNTLSNKTLKLGEGYDAVDKNFIMAGLDIATKGNNNNATGTIPLYRAASKITITVNVPDRIVTRYESAEEVEMTPVLNDNLGNITLLTAFHNGVSKTYLRNNYSSKNEDFFSTDKKGYSFVKEIAAEGETPKKYQYTCNVPFYSYARVWEKGADNAVYLTLEIPWKNESTDTYQTYYYQILVNGAGREFKPNCWYDLTVNVGVLGSTVESEPVLIEDMTFYVLDWTTEPESDSGDRYENVNIENYTYLQVPEKYIVMNNTTIGELKFDASHNVKWSMEWPTDVNNINILDQLEKVYNSNTKYYAYYINCGNTPPSSASLQGDINSNDFSLNSAKNSIIFNYPKGDIDKDIYSPVYVHLKLWLDIDGAQNQPNGIETKFVEYVTFVYYPPMYIIPEESVYQSVYVNGRRATSASHNVIYVNGQTYDLGGAPGNDDSRYMHTITVSSFTENDTFEIDGNKYSYIIGDPRVRVSDINLNDDGYDMAANGAWASDAANRKLEHYYPAGTEGDVFRVISPKFRVSSKLGGYSEGDREGVMMRCASYQENGYPAGRWRVPTTAEIAFIVYLQAQNAIPELFVNNHYFSSTHMVTQDGDKASIVSIDGDDHSVRCVYDEWYWGTDKEAIRNQSVNDASAGNYYNFTWGDKQIWEVK